MLIQLFRAPGGIAVDGLTLLGSTLGVSLIRGQEPPPAARTARRPLWREIGGVLGETIGLAATTLVATCGGALAFVWLWLSPIPALRAIPNPRERAT